MESIKTNRDFYLGISALRKSKEDDEALSLEQYLENLLHWSQPHGERISLSLQLAFDLLNQSFKAAEIVDDEQVTPNRVDPEYRVWRDVVSDQIKDLRAMKENGQLERDDKYFGMDAPSGNRWYNFDLFGYLECATAGAFGGWEDGDDTGRILVSGQVGFIDENGNFDSRDARDIEQLTIEMPGITWEQFSEFIHCGRLYE